MEGSENTSGVKVGMVGKGVGEGKVGRGVVVANETVGIGSVIRASVGREIGDAVAVGIAFCVSAKAVLTVDMAVSMISASLNVGVAMKVLQETSAATRNKRMNVLPKMFTLPLPFILGKETPNGLRYPLVGGTRQRHFAGTSFKPRKPLENAATPTGRVHAVLGSLKERKFHHL